MPTTLEDLRAAASHMRSYPAFWLVAGGWSIDLFLGRVTRPHSDLEIGTARHDQQRLRGHWPDHGWQVARDGEWVDWRAAETIALPDFQLKATDAAGIETEFFLNDVDEDGTWHFRRNPAVTRPAASLVRRTTDADPVPYLIPEVMLLFKAKHHRPKDDADFDNALPRLDAAERAWLRHALERTHPNDPWLTRLGGS